LEDALSQLNVFGEPIKECSCEPLTGYFRDGFCNTEENDLGLHIICAQMSQAFLDFSLEQGNDLVTPQPHYGFPGLKHGDRWCVCADRWKQALASGVAPKIVLESTHQAVLDVVPMSVLKSYAIDIL